MKTEVYNLFIKDLTILDCAILDPQRGPIGMSWHIGIEFIGSLNEEGVVFDFSYAKKTAKKVIDSTADHAFIVPTDKLLSVSPGYFQIKDTEFEYTAPGAAFFNVDTVTENNIFSKLEGLILEECKKNKDCAELKAVKLIYTKEDDKECSYYHYTHGLKNHYGHCARLIHGHRSLIEIYVNDVRSKEIEQAVADEYHDKHLVFKENIVDEDEYFYFISYKTPEQGNYDLKIKKSACILYPYETTVENISKYIAEKFSDNYKKQHRIKVVAYEGIRKGSIFVKTKNEKINTMKLFLG